MQEIFTALGMPAGTPSTADTPRRFVQVIFEATSGYKGDEKAVTAFPTECRDGPDCRISQVVEGPIPFSPCASITACRSSAGRCTCAPRCAASARPIPPPGPATGAATTTPTRSCGRSSSGSVAGGPDRGWVATAGTAQARAGLGWRWPSACYTRSRGSRLAAAGRADRRYGGDLGFAGPCLYANFIASPDGVTALGPEYPSSGSAISGCEPADRFAMALLRVRRRRADRRGHAARHSAPPVDARPRLAGGRRVRALAARAAAPPCPS